MNRYLLMAHQPYAFAILRPLAAAIHARGGETAWFLHGVSPTRLASSEKLLQTVEAVKAFNPRAVFVCGNWVPHFFPGVKVQVFHGFSVNKRSPRRGHFRIRGFFDLYCTQGPDTTGPFRELEARHGHFKVVETGWPKTDPLFDPAVSTYPITHDRPVILMTSTFTDTISCAKALRETVHRLSQQGRWRWLVTFHPKMPQETVASYRALQNEYLEFIETDDIIQLYKAADVMLSDTTSSVPEFLLQQKPVVTYRNRKPGPHLIDVQQTGQIEDALERALHQPPELMRHIAEYVEHIHPYSDGHSSERVLDATERFITEGGTDPLKAKPWDPWRKFQARQRLGYFKLS